MRQGMPLTVIVILAHCFGLAAAQDGCLPQNCEAPGCANWLTSDELALQSLRQQPLWGDLKYSVGGELRYRYMDEINRLRPLGELRRDTYQLWRFTPFVEVGNDWIKGYVEAIDAPIFNEDLPKLPIDENRTDLVQYYLDVKLLEFDGDPLRFRYGRQTLLYGAQHLISPLGWSNTYRTFEGGKAYYTSSDWNVDAFSVRPSNGAASAQVFRPTSFDIANQDILFSGVYATYKKAPNGVLDLYWLWLNVDEQVLTDIDGNRHTIGARYAGSKPVKDGDKVLATWNWDLESAFQFGEDDFRSGGRDLNVSAGFVSTIGGVTLNDIPWSPSIKGVFWWGSGDRNPNDGQIHTVTTLYPLGHAYWGLIDNFNGANLLDYSIQLAAKPTKKLTLGCDWHWFDKASARTSFTMSVERPWAT